LVYCTPWSCNLKTNLDNCSFADTRRPTSPQ
jgi:hypothetical protein